MREAYSKRLHLLIHGIEEKCDNVWETKTETRETFNIFLIKLDPESIKLVDSHRLPQHLIVREIKE